MSENNGALGASHLDWLRTRHAQLKADRTKDMEVPGYDGRVVVRYGPVPWAVITKVRPLVDDGGTDPRTLNAANQDVLIAACRDVLVRDDAGELERVSDNGPVTFGPDLAALLGAEQAASAREVVDWLFPSEWAVAQHAGDLITWTRDAAHEDNDVLVGE